MQLYVEVIFRTIAAFVLLMITSRILGKQTISNMTFHDFVSGITLGSIAANLAFNDKLTHWTIAVSLLTFFGISFLVSRTALENRTWNRLVSGTPTVVIENGKILDDNMRKIRYTLDSLTQSLREKDIFDIEEIEYACLEDHGKLSVKKKSEYEWVTRKDLKLHAAAVQSFPVELIMDGRIMEDNLAHNGLTVLWLEQVLRQKNKSVSDVFYAVRGTQNKLYFDYYQDHIDNPID
ncbi:DUF421 domain-containing protein [Paenibacillus sacheonensis]|uniref:DUF421 domain-containing protein n=1 Tax=Paenibacillus sacheonensis TaxID=742054 RepID=UPI0014783388|nr:DUF421 domain-containing protein [Paenibacillus sacheonensis]MBM7567890.1 uncharacterized membrane protein YcaP (DUF421 family) [Paenibacillus sacheonensis]